MTPREAAVARGWVELAAGVFVRRYRFYDQNIGVILGDGEALVIDTRSTYPQARELIEHIRGLTPFPVTVVVDTHGHFDHAFGNALFRPAAIWGHAGCPPFMTRTGEARKAVIATDEPDLADALSEVVIDPPDRTFAGETTIEVGGRTVALRHVGRGHTDHDLVVTVPGTPVVFGGDLVEEGNVPFYGDGFAFDWPSTAEALAGLVEPTDGILVPGHGEPGGRTFAVAQAASITALAALARRVHARTMTQAEAIAAHPFPDLPAEDALEALRRAVTELERAKPPA